LVYRRVDTPDLQEAKVLLDKLKKVIDLSMKAVGGLFLSSV
jgi:hypothetical protein